jgi:hypothetical protein
LVANLPDIEQSTQNVDLPPFDRKMEKRRALRHGNGRIRRFFKRTGYPTPR